MVVEIKQRPYIQGFLDFVKSFLITESVTIDELNLVKANLNILNGRIADAGDSVISYKVVTDA